MEVFESLLRDHLAATFPTTAHALELPNHDLEMLDADIAGLATSFRDAGVLTVEQAEILKGCQMDAEAVIPLLTGEIQAYFARLEALAAATLRIAPVRGSSLL